ncbi:MAG: hypothetical protein A3F04_01630 [Candidatus Chisholmbacteria bacterium RIFCSPHIGHO2_12_FULL_49_9]|uniref:Uncharacterized protein n=1 Tax=Candidatus Chisholmbacteria bacterium RIFCSPHIGHO2_01_FULL_52_32 TaxID=1797591 RepID=A0A1G1VUL2_9BACT|nr:MAG: hypothetical protein A2786_06220 [Candidatus Chisholmbacteria bacterium RIFCSPHIGHO2_01_FULL_52_32]OGY19698.1 MAG: hypothetical protein A2900_01160 [Candidatus Chisholmbacteria bacterium RIFCSPLOWO2_01_FULL_50_28]OGY20708.1 MAG: hypothetical protein A3F04_01630 [Candidatus Chisholmbacteria bacterium RIFCSPHIGHO2_12_FULL_49_9]
MPTIRRRNFLPALFFALLFWGVVGFFIFFVDPELVRDWLFHGTYLPFFLSLWLALFLTASLLFAHTRRGFLLSFGVIVFLALRVLGLGHLLNAILLFSFLVFFELALSARPH